MVTEQSEESKVISVLCYPGKLESIWHQTLQWHSFSPQRQDIWAIALALKSAKLEDTLQPLTLSVSLDKILNLSFCLSLLQDFKTDTNLLARPLWTPVMKYIISTLMAITAQGFNDQLLLFFFLLTILHYFPSSPVWIYLNCTEHLYLILFPLIYKDTVNC